MKKNKRSIGALYGVLSNSFCSLIENLALANNKLNDRRKMYDLFHPKKFETLN